MIVAYLIIAAAFFVHKDPTDQVICEDGSGIQEPNAGSDGRLLAALLSP